MAAEFVISIVVIWAWWCPGSVGQWAASVRQRYERGMRKEEPRP